MSTLQQISTQLAIYKQLAFHGDATLANTLAHVQVWQKQRMAEQHRTLFAQPSHRLMGQYFLQRLYAGPDFDMLAKQFDKMLGKLHKIESLVPDSVVATSVLGIQLAITAIELDQQLAQHIIAQHGDTAVVSDATMTQAIVATNQQTVRAAHLQLLTQLGYKLDQYMRSFVVKTAFKMAKNKAYDKGFSPLYDFTAEGFTAMKDIKSTEQFIAQFVASELQYIGDLQR